MMNRSFVGYGFSKEPETAPSSVIYGDLFYPCSCILLMRIDRGVFQSTDKLHLAF